MAGYLQDWTRAAVIATLAAAKIATATPAYADKKEIPLTPGIQTTQVTDPTFQQKARAVLDLLPGDTPAAILTTDDIQSAIGKMSKKAKQMNARGDYGGLKHMIAEGIINAATPLGKQAGKETLTQALEPTLPEIMKDIGQGGQPHEYFSDDGKAAFIVVPGSSKELFKPTEQDKTFFEKSTGIKNLDQALGPRTAEKVRAFCFLHEGRHTGDTVLGQDIANEKEKGVGLSIDKTQERAGEVRADLMAAQLYHGMTGDLDFIKDFSHMRTLEMMKAGGMGHATQYALNDWIKSVDPKAAMGPALPDAAIGPAYNSLVKTLWIKGATLMDQKGIKRPATPSEEGAYLMQAIPLCLEKGLITNPDAKTMALGVVNSMQYFDDKMQKSPAPSIDGKNTAKTTEAPRLRVGLSAQP